MRIEPLVSVVTPVYNGAEYISECIESVLSQTYQNWEYIIVDNCSTDQTLEIAKRYARTDHRIRVINHHEFLPAIGNHNRALRYISVASKYCKLIFADDWMFCECLEKMVAIAEEQPSVGLVAAYSLQNGSVMWTGLPYPSRRVGGREMCRRLFLEGLYVFGSASTVLYRSEFVRRDHFYNPANFHADSEACIEILKHSDFGFVNQVLIFQRVRTESLSTFSSDLNTYIAGKLQELVAHGRDFLSEDEFKACLERRLTRYYENLFGGMWRGSPKSYWDYHKKKLADAGVPFSRRRLTRVGLSKLLDSLLDPKCSIEKFLRGRADSKQLAHVSADEEKAKAVLA